MSRTYVVTGANRGIGLELARQLSARGQRVIDRLSPSDTSRFFDHRGRTVPW